MSTNNMKYVAYLRKSSEQEDRQSMSIPAQKSSILKMFPSMQIVEWIEESKSAYTPGRPGLERALELIESGQAHGLVGWHPDRLSRNEIDAGKICWYVRNGIIKDLKFGSYGFDNSPEGMMMLQGVLSHSQYYSAKLSKDVRRGNVQRRSIGYTTGLAIEGYLNVIDRGRITRNIMIKDPDRFQLRRRMWDLMLTGKYSIPGVQQIANEEWGYKTRGNKRFPSGPVSRNGLYAMFKNPRYAGIIPHPYWNGIDKLDETNSEKAEFPAMVTTEEFDIVQDLLGVRGVRKLASKKTFAYRGLMKCGECGCAVTAEETRKRTADGGLRTYVHYHCTRKRPCTQKRYINEQELEQQLEDLLRQYEILPAFKNWALETLDEQNDSESEDIARVLQTQDKAILEAHNEMKRLIKMAAKEMISEDEFNAEKNELSTSITSLEKARQLHIQNADNWYDTAINTFELAVNARHKFLTGTFDDKKEIIANIGQELVLIDSKIKLSPHPWMVSVGENASYLNAAYEKVRTMPQQIQKASEEAVRSSWLGMRDSNPRSRDQNPVPYHLANSH